MEFIFPIAVLIAFAVFLGFKIGKRSPRTPTNLVPEREVTREDWDAYWAEQERK